MQRPRQTPPSSSPRIGASPYAAVTGATIQTFDGFADGTIIPNGSTVAGATYTLVSPGGEDFVVSDTFPPLSLPNTLGRTPGEFFLDTDVLTFSFPVPVTAFVISTNTFAAATGSYTLTTNLGDMAPSFFDPLPGFGTGQFAGFISDTPILSVTFTGGGGFPYTLDDLAIATPFGPAVPEPATVTSAGLAALTLLGVAWRRRRKTIA